MQRSSGFSTIFVIYKSLNNDCTLVNIYLEDMAAKRFLHMMAFSTVTTSFSSSTIGVFLNDDEFISNISRAKSSARSSSENEDDAVLFMVKTTKIIAHKLILKTNTPILYRSLKTNYSASTLLSSK